MGVNIIKTKDRRPYRKLYHDFEDKFFSGEFETAPNPTWSDSPFLFSHFSLNDNNTVGSLAAFILTHKETFDEVLAGKTKEHEIKPFTQGCVDRPYLYWPTLIIENRAHAPYLLKSIFREVDAVCREWELQVSHVYSIAFSKVSERLLKKYNFQKAGMYEGKYPIMISEVNTNPYLYAFLTYKFEDNKDRFNPR